MIYMLSVFLLSCNKGVSFFALQEGQDSSQATALADLDFYSWSSLQQRRYLLLAEEDYMAGKEQHLKPDFIVKTPPRLPIDSELELIESKENNHPPPPFASPLRLVPPVHHIFSPVTTLEPKKERLRLEQEALPTHKTSIPWTQPLQVTVPSPPALDLKVTAKRPDHVWVPPPAETPVIKKPLALEQASKEQKTPQQVSYSPGAPLPEVQDKPLSVKPSPQKERRSVAPITGKAFAQAGPHSHKELIHLKNADFKPAPLVEIPDLSFKPAPSQPKAQPGSLGLSAVPTKPDPVFIPRPLDIIFVMDTSKSMMKNLMDFKERFADFLAPFSALKWRLMITDADHGDTWLFLLNKGATKGKALPLERDGHILQEYYIDHFMPHYNQIFLSSISLHRYGDYKRNGPQGPENIPSCDLPPGCQNYKEQPLKSLKSALTKNPDFFREEADLVAILISNSPEVSLQKSSSATTPEAVIQEFLVTHGPHKRFAVYGLIVTEGDQECLQENWAHRKFFPEAGVSRQIMDLSEKTGGEVFSLCAPDYQEMALHIVDSFLSPL